MFIPILLKSWLFSDTNQNLQKKYKLISPSLLKSSINQKNQKKNNCKLFLEEESFLKMPIFQNLLNFKEQNQNSQVQSIQEQDQQQKFSQQSLLPLTTNLGIVGPSKFKRNSIDERVTSMQYEANNPCEDKYIYEQLKSIDAYTVSIFDGHGGPQLAQYSKVKINSYIDSYIQQKLKDKNLIQNIGQIIKESLKWSYKKIQDTFYEIYEQQIKLGNKKIKNVGTCAITAIIHNDKVYLGNSGDSQAIFILKQGKDLIRSQKANDRLSVNNKSQRQKILKEWSDIDSNIIVQDTQNTYYLKGRLQPTRTIGDYYLKKQQHYIFNDKFKGPYLSCEPNINQHKITKSHQFLVIASDGVWDFLSKNEVMKYLIDQNEIDLTKTCYSIDDNEQEIPYINNVVNNVLQKASEYSGKSVYDLKQIKKGIRRNYHDDITIAVINLENQ